MSDSTRLQGDRVYCHVCEHQWDRAHGGLQCPNCESEFVEIVESNSVPQTQQSTSSPIERPTQSPSHALQDHNPWAPDPDEDDITTFEFNSGNNRGTFSFTSRTYTFGGNVHTRTNVDPSALEVTRNFESMVNNILGRNTARRPPTMMGGFFPMGQSPGNERLQQDTPQNRPPDLFSMLFQSANGTRDQAAQGRPTNAFDILGFLLNPANAQHGDTVYSQEAFDRIMTQMMEQNQSSGAPGPATEEAINALKQKPVTAEMMGNDGKAECSICMDSVSLDEVVTFLPCNHWFHHDCVVSWLKEHDTCPHCRQPISNTASTPSQSSRSRRRSSRRSSSVASPFSPPPNTDTRSSNPAVDTPSGLRNARQRYYGSQSGASQERPGPERQSSSRSERFSDDGDSGGANGVGGWLRSRLPFS